VAICGPHIRCVLTDEPTYRRASTPFCTMHQASSKTLGYRATRSISSPQVSLASSCSSQQVSSHLEAPLDFLALTNLQSLRSCTSTNWGVSPYSSAVPSAWQPATSSSPVSLPAMRTAGPATRVLVGLPVSSCGSLSSSSATHGVHVPGLSSQRSGPCLTVRMVLRSVLRLIG